MEIITWINDPERSMNHHPSPTHIPNVQQAVVQLLSCSIGREECHRLCNRRISALCFWISCEYAKVTTKNLHVNFFFSFLASLFRNLTTFPDLYYSVPDTRKLKLSQMSGLTSLMSIHAIVTGRDRYAISHPSNFRSFRKRTKEKKKKEKQLLPRTKTYPSVSSRNTINPTI